MVAFVKGHGTENDFVLLPDVAAVLSLSPERVRRLCDRRAGIGADGVIRIVPTAAVPQVAGQAHAAPWFMDYFNADGSVAEMCGNGARVFACYLVDHGLAAASSFAIATRGGVKPVEVPEVGDITVDMGPCTPMQPATVAVDVAGRSYTGTTL